MRVIYFSNQPAPYQELLSTYLNKELEFKFIYLNPSLTGRNSEWAKILGNNHFLGNSSMGYEIRKFQPDIVVFLGVFKKELFSILFFKYLYGFKLAVFTEVLRNHKNYRYRNPFLVFGYLKLISPLVDYFLCGNEFVKFQLELANINVKKLKLINYPIIHIDRRTSYENNSDTFRVLHANRLDKLNNPTEIIRQFDIIKKHKKSAILYLFKEGLMYDEVKVLVGERSDIKFFSNVRYDKLDDFYSTFDILLNARNFGSGNNSTIEAMCQGVVPIIHKGTVGSREQIFNGVTGFGYYTFGDFEKSFLLYLGTSLDSINRIKCNNENWIMRSPKRLFRQYIDLFNSL